MTDTLLVSSKTDIILPTLQNAESQDKHNNNSDSWILGYKVTVFLNNKL
jgi:hypothetical protein